MSQYSRGAREDAGVTVVAVGAFADRPRGGRSRTWSSCRRRPSRPRRGRRTRCRRPRSCRVGGSVAVVVRAVADLHAAGVARAVPVVAVGAVADVADGRLAGDEAHARVAVEVAVVVQVPGPGVGARAGVGGPVAVVVDAVADLGLAGVDLGVAVVAVIVDGPAVAVGVHGGRVGVDVDGVALDLEESAGGQGETQQGQEQGRTHGVSPGVNILPPHQGDDARPMAARLRSLRSFGGSGYAGGEILVEGSWPGFSAKRRSNQLTIISKEPNLKGFFYHGIRVVSTGA